MEGGRGRLCECYVETNTMIVILYSYTSKTGVSVSATYTLTNIEQHDHKKD